METKSAEDLVDYSSRLKSTEQLAEVARREIDEDHPLLNALATVYCWSILDSFIRDYLALWITRRPSSRKVEPLQRIRIYFGEYESLNPHERNHYIIGRMAEELGVNRKHGLYRFRLLLEPFGLSFKLSNNLERDLIELQNVRNIIVHRNGLVDRRFQDACPWIKQNIGSKIIIDTQQNMAYYLAANAVIVNLIYEVGSIYGVDYEKEKAEWRP